jgi:hypothetical protein
MRILSPKGKTWDLPETPLQTGNRRQLTLRNAAPPQIREPWATATLRGGALRTMMARGKCERRAA